MALCGRGNRSRTNPILVRAIRFNGGGGGGGGGGLQSVLSASHATHAHHSPRPLFSLPPSISHSRALFPRRTHLLFFSSLIVYKIYKICWHSGGVSDYAPPPSVSTTQSHATTNPPFYPTHPPPHSSLPSILLSLPRIFKAPVSVSACVVCRSTPPPM